jgi:AcrR family transcriptional regulator
MPDDRPNQNVARGAVTREHLLSIATTLFAERGFEATSIESVLQQAGVSRGSLYYHFKGKDALFEAVLEALETDVGRRTVEAAAAAAGPAAALRAGCLAWIEIAGDPVVQRILLIDAPSVLGWDRWRAMEERHALGLIKDVLRAISAEGSLAPDLVDIFSHVVLATVNEIALLIARSDQTGAAMRTAGAAIDEVLARLLHDRVHDAGTAAN